MSNFFYENWLQRTKGLTQAISSHFIQIRKVMDCFSLLTHPFPWVPSEDLNTTGLWLYRGTGSAWGCCPQHSVLEVLGLPKLLLTAMPRFTSTRPEKLLCQYNSLGFCHMREVQVLKWAKLIPHPTLLPFFWLCDNTISTENFGEKSSN